MHDDWEDTMYELESAEDFFVFFGVAFDPHLVRVNRLHILQRFHDNLAMTPMPEASADRFTAYAAQLAAAHADFAQSTPKQEKIFRVFQSLPDEPAFVPLANLTRH